MLVPAPAAPDVSCPVCCRTFKSRSGFTRHKCTAVRQLPIEEQPGAQQCPACQRWFRSAGGLAVHKCSSTSGVSPSVSASASAVAASPNRLAISTMACCSFHCNMCKRCCKSNAGFCRHNCHRGHQHPSARDTFEHVCPTCSRKFHRPSDLKRHKCRSS